jgi:hypothetical protein
VDRLRLVVGFDYIGSTVKLDGHDDPSLLLFPSNSESTTLNVALASVLYRGLGATLRVSRVLEGLRVPQITTFAGALFYAW